MSEILIPDSSRYDGTPRRGYPSAKNSDRHRHRRSCFSRQIFFQVGEIVGPIAPEQRRRQGRKCSGAQRCEYGGYQRGRADVTHERCCWRCGGRGRGAGAASAGRREYDGEGFSLFFFVQGKIPIHFMRVFTRDFLESTGFAVAIRNKHVDYVAVMPATSSRRRSFWQIPISTNQI